MALPGWNCWCAGNYRGDSTHRRTAATFPGTGRPNRPGAGSGGKGLASRGGPDAPDATGGAYHLHRHDALRGVRGPRDPGPAPRVRPLGSRLQGSFPVAIAIEHKDPDIIGEPAARWLRAR